MGALVERLQRLEVEAGELTEMVKWPESLVDDYLSIHNDLLEIASGVETVLDITAVPAASGSPGVKGQVAMDASYFYWCIATNSWIRVAGGVF